MPDSKPPLSFAKGTLITRPRSAALAHVTAVGLEIDDGIRHEPTRPWKGHVPAAPGLEELDAFSARSSG